MDGANIEIREECGWKLSQYCSVREPCFFASHVSGEDTMFIFGCLEHEAVTLKRGLTPLFLWLLLLLLAYDDVDELSCNVQVAGVAAKAKNGDYPIDSRLQAVFQVGLVPAEAASAFSHVHDLKSSWRQFAMVSSPGMSRRPQDAQDLPESLRPCLCLFCEAHGEFCSLIDKLCNTYGAGTWEGAVCKFGWLSPKKLALRFLRGWRALALP